MLEGLGIDLTQVLGQVVLLVVLAILPAIGRLVGRFISEKIKETDNALLAKIAGIAVLFVEKRMKNAGSDAKFQAAFDYIEKKLKKLGIKVDREDIEKVIEATLEGFIQSTGDLKN